MTRPKLLSKETLAALPEIVAFLKADAETRTTKTAREYFYAAALFLEKQLPVSKQVKPEPVKPHVLTDYERRVQRAKMMRSKHISLLRRVLKANGAEGFRIRTSDLAALLPGHVEGR